MRAFIRYCKIWCSQIMGDLSLSRDCPEFTLSGHTVGSGWAGGHGPRPTFEGWTNLGHIVAVDLVWMFLGFCIQYLSKNCPNCGYHDIHAFLESCGTWTFCGQTWDFRASREWPMFVQLQRDQTANGKIMKSILWLIFVYQFFSPFWPTKMMKRGQRLALEDKNWIWWGQNWDFEDIYWSYMGQGHT